MLALLEIPLAPMVFQTVPDAYRSGLITSHVCIHDVPTIFDTLSDLLLRSSRIQPVSSLTHDAHCNFFFCIYGTLFDPPFLGLRRLVMCVLSLVYERSHPGILPLIILADVQEFDSFIVLFLALWLCAALERLVAGIETVLFNDNGLERLYFGLYSDDLRHGKFFKIFLRLWMIWS